MSELSESDVLTFIDGDSSAPFELAVLSLVDACFPGAKHSGSYVDPITGKIRQYDIIATAKNAIIPLAGGNLRLHKALMAIECKHVHPRNPIILGCVKNAGLPVLVNGLKTHSATHHIFDCIEKFNLKDVSDPDKFLQKWAHILALAWYRRGAWIRMAKISSWKRDPRMTSMTSGHNVLTRVFPRS